LLESMPDLSSPGPVATPAWTYSCSKSRRASLTRHSLSRRRAFWVSNPTLALKLALLADLGVHVPEMCSGGSIRGVAKRWGVSRGVVRRFIAKRAS
jgi:hypothetical protein